MPSRRARMGWQRLLPSVEMSRPAGGFQTGCPEEVSFSQGFVDAAALRPSGRGFGKSPRSRHGIEPADGP